MPSWTRIRCWLAVKFWPKHHGSRSFCANRSEYWIKYGKLELTLRILDTSQPDGYSREELVVMLRTVRAHEAIQGWKVPEPTSSALG